MKNLIILFITLYLLVGCRAKKKNMLKEINIEKVEQLGSIFPVDSLRGIFVKVNNVASPDSDRVFYNKESVICSTQDGGANWTEFSLGLGHVKDFYLYSDRIFCIKNEYFGKRGDQRKSVIYKSDDFGITWSLLLPLDFSADGLFIGKDSSMFLNKDEGFCFFNKKDQKWEKVIQNNYFNSTAQRKVIGEFLVEVGGVPKRPTDIKKNIICITNNRTDSVKSKVYPESTIIQDFHPLINGDCIFLFKNENKIYKARFIWENGIVEDVVQICSSLDDIKIVCEVVGVFKDREVIIMSEISGFSIQKYLMIWEKGVVLKKIKLPVLTSEIVMNNNVVWLKSEGLKMIII